MEAKGVNPGTRRIGLLPRVGRTPLTVPELIDYLVIHRDTQSLFRKFPELQPEDLRDAVEYAARAGYLT